MKERIGQIKRTPLPITLNSLQAMPLSSGICTTTGRIVIGCKSELLITALIPHFAFMRCTYLLGGALIKKMSEHYRIANLPKCSQTILTTWDLPMWNFCQSWNIPSAALGGIKQLGILPLRVA